MRSFALVLTFVAFTSVASAQSQGPWVKIGSDGKLVYQTDDHGNRIPDFSNCGYGGGGVPILDVPVKATVEPGADDAGARIQAAIDAVSKLPADTDGFRGAVLLKKGKYAVAGQIRIETSGVVLRGEGQDPNGTVIVATGAHKRSLVVIGKGKSRTVGDDEDDEESATASEAAKPSDRHITDEYVSVGARSFHVDDVSGLKVGNEIIVKRLSTADWIHTIGMDRIPQNKAGNVVQWKPGTKDLSFSRVVTGIAGNEITVDAPLCNAIEKKFGRGRVIICPPYHGVSHAGVENLRGDSEFKNPDDEEHGWNLVDLTDARNFWVRKVTAIHFGYSCVYVHRSCKWVTIEDCACLDPVSKITGGRRYSFALDGQLTLVQHCSARGGRHDFVMHALAAGPNVFLDCVAENCHADSGPHHRWSAGVLYDNVTAGELNVRNRGNAGTGHGWAGANQVLWNCTAKSIICEQPPTAQNWAIGCDASKHSGNGYWESFGQHIQPRSLYLAQLRERLDTAASTK
jgi:hypothetical protein